jgi:hypothetical protein
LQESDQEKARRIIAEEIRRLKFLKIDLSQLDKSDPRKVAIARRPAEADDSVSKLDC